MKKLFLLTICVAFAQVGVAENNSKGFYLGGQFGIPFTDNNTITNVYSGDLVFNHAELRGIGYRGALGYNFTPHLGLELGYTYYGKLEEQQGPSDFGGLPVNTDASVKQQSVELMGLYHVPLNQKWDFYLKGGLAYLKGNFEYNVSFAPGTTPLPVPVANGGSYHASGIEPAYGVGIGRNFDDGHFYLGADWNKVSAWWGNYDDSLNSKLQSSSLVSLNMIYRFNDYSSVTPDNEISTNSDASGIYIGGFGGFGIGTLTLNTGTQITPALTTGMINIGYMFNRHIGLEADGLWLHNGNVNRDSYADPDDAPNVNVYGVAGMVKFDVPVTKQFDMFSKLGLLNGLTWTYVLGAGYNFTPKFQANIQYISLPYVFSGMANLNGQFNIFGLGFNYHF